MGYKQDLLDSNYLKYLPNSLYDHLHGEELADASTEYLEINVQEEPVERKIQPTFRSKPSDVRLPARLSSPLIPYPQEVKNIIETNEENNAIPTHGHHRSQLESLNQVMSALQKSERLPTAKYRYGMDDLKRFARQKFSSREDLINLATVAFARRATNHDLGIAAKAVIDFPIQTSNTCVYTPFIIMVQRLRIHIAKESVFQSFSAEKVPVATDEANYIMFDNGVYLYYSDNPVHKFYIMACGGHFRIYNKNLDYWFCGPTSYFDYIFTVSDILNNLDMLKNCAEYNWASSMFNIMIEFTQVEGHHNSQVNFMKGIEGFLLNMSDYDEEFAMNWKPILEVAYDLWKLDKIINDLEYDFGLIMCLLRGKNFQYDKNSFLCRLIVEAMKLTRNQRQEISALHKLIFYAEVDAKAGVMKFLKRVHSPRKIDKIAVKNITRFAKMHFLIAYRKRHKNLPNVIGPPAKIRMLEAYSQRGDYSTIEKMNLSWWDDMKLFDCMDNTLTDDPLEFAKDKGALKEEVSYGPGDSRKELLQVIEKPEYSLGDFFSNRTLRPKPKRIVRTNQLKEPIKQRDSARLIEKEREQKIEARLFGNASLENKHNLSLVATKMKKALAYFDEQLMTPADNKRKKLIHEAARSLAYHDNYSLLLDIEGHNQSMQYENTSELCEFVGHLFGKEGWSELPHYFSSLTVYHYDDYLDDVTLSEGQLGGIEGWLNPLWTLHSTIVMKLLRVMTDLEVKEIMVYSDDVDAILCIKQASEAMVKSVFGKIMTHFSKFGMTVKYSQTTLSKHRVTMLRQHYSDGVRSDSTLKRLLSVSAANNPVLVSEELEIAGICSSAASAMELSNHNEACAYLKNYKVGLLLSRLPQMILSKPSEQSMISTSSLPKKLANLLYYVKDDASALNLLSDPTLMAGAVNDISAYLGRNPNTMNKKLLSDTLNAVYGQSISEYKLVDSPDRLLYLQIYDPFIQDLMFFWAYLPTSIGGLGGALHLNLMLSGHSVGFSKSLHYLYQWIIKFSSEKDYFLKYLSVTLSIDEKEPANFEEVRLMSSVWQNDRKICPASTSVKQSIKSMVRRFTRNRSVLEMFSLSDDSERLAKEYLEIFRGNFHSRIAQFYYENTSVHFVDLLISKVETSSGLLTRVRDINKLRQRLSRRTLDNIRMASVDSRTIYFDLTDRSDIIDCLSKRKALMFPKISLIEVEEVLYDDKIEEVETSQAMLTVRRCSPMHYRDGMKVFDDPKLGNETLYKGELIDNDRMLGNKEELLAAKLVAVTKWFLSKNNLINSDPLMIPQFDCVKACNLSLMTLTGQTFADLFHFAPTETGGEILHRIPNMRFSTSTYIRSEMNRALTYTSDLNQNLITRLNLVDGNVNFDYLKMRFLVAAIICDKYDKLRRLVVRYAFSNLVGIRDVQFVVPEQIDYVVEKKFACYAVLRKHEMSNMRFRYLAHAYLYEENIGEWAMMPSFAEAKTSEELGDEYLNDLILRYSRDLDKDYMLISKEHIDPNLWMPLIVKLRKLEKTWEEKSVEELIIEIRDRLEKVLQQRAMITTVNKSNRVHLSLQQSCMEAIVDRGPSDLEYETLSRRFAQIMQNRRGSRTLSFRLAKYQSMLNDFEFHKYNLAKTLLMEYIVTFHFKVSVVGSMINLDVDKALEEFSANPMGRISHTLFSPELQVRLMVLGMDYVEQIAIDGYSDIRRELFEICEDLSLADVIMPVNLPTLSDYTLLTGDEWIPSVLDEIEYTGLQIDYSAMGSLHEIEALCSYAHKCSTSGAKPEAFISFTGSDSLGAQIGLFRYLKNNNLIDCNARNCDLTAGRGDGQYAARHTGINMESFSLEDTFTRLNHHPDITFKKDYDIFDGSSLKFVTAFDFVHVDVSFAGKGERNILDLILFFEENLLSYSIRINSVTCRGYSKETLQSLPVYDHRICYATNSSLKPYQIYLVGTPSEGEKRWSGNNIRSTVAFKSLALGFSKLLSPCNYFERLTAHQPNSVSVFFPRGNEQAEFILSICDKSIAREQQYYADRYISDVGRDGKIPIILSMLEKSGRNLMKQRPRLLQTGDSIILEGDVDRIIGKVSVASKPFHENHVRALMKTDSEIVQFSPLHCDRDVLIYFRSRHPLAEVRSWCNIALGLHKFCYSEFQSGFDAIMELSKNKMGEIGQRVSMHQREIHMAIKLLVLSASRDDYTYGIRYCHNLLSNQRKSSSSLLRTLKCYRMISFLFDSIRGLLRTGIIRISHINAIRNEYEEREMKKYKYEKISENIPLRTKEMEDIEQTIFSSIDDLFVGLEQYANAIVEQKDDESSLDTVEGAFAQMNSLFDIGLTDQIDFMVKKLNLQPSGPRGIIDLGDDDLYEDEDW